MTSDSPSIYSVAEAKRRFAELLDRVAAGERILITRRGKPAVALVPPEMIRPGARWATPTGFAALAGALADVDGFDQTMTEVIASRRGARDRPTPDLI